MAIAAIAAFAAFLPAAASADSSTTAIHIFGDPANPSPVPGAHEDYTIRQDFNYGNGPEPAAGTEDLKKWIVDSPAGLAGNPNAIPYADRCDLAAFDPVPGPNSQLFNSSCPASSKVGEAAVYLATDAVSGAVPGGTPLPAMLGEIFILKTDPEIPTTLATRFTTAVHQQPVCDTFPGSPTAPCPVYPKTQSLLQPVTSGVDGDFRIRTVPKEYTAAQAAYLPTGSGFAAGPTPLHIYRIDQHLFGLANNGNPFLTYPTRSSDWKSYSYLHTQGANGAATQDNLDPNNASDLYTSDETSITPNQSVKPPLSASIYAAFSTSDRSQNPQLDVVVTNPVTPGADVPKHVVVTLPGSIAADIDALAVEKLCTVAQRNASSCPAASKAGTVKVETPFISAGLTGDVYLVKKDEGGLPDLAIFVTGAISFRLDATTKYVGAGGTSIETTLVNLPQTLFTKFSLTINGGQPDSLLTYRDCPADGSAPLDGPITSTITGYTDAVVNNSSATNFNGCYGSPRVSSVRKCVKYKLKFTPRNLINRENIMKIEVYIKGRFGKAKRYKVYRKSPFKISQPLAKRRFTSKRNYKYKVRVVYDPTVDAPKGKVLVSKYAKFKKC